VSRFEVGAVCDRGLNPRRPINEDRFLAMPEKGLFAVADGVGGELAGEVASQTVVDALAEAMRSYDFKGDLEDFLELTLQHANKRIYEAASTHEELSGMASTVALVCIEDSRATIAHVGDSRVYSLSGGKLKRETRDHTDLEDALRAGEITELEAQQLPARNVINRAAGAEAEIEPEFSSIDISRVDAILLCTDGITRHIPDTELEEILTSDLAPQQMCEEMKWRCHCRGAEDNLTAIVVKMFKADEERTLPPSRPKARIERKEQIDTASRKQSPVRVEVDISAAAEPPSRKSAERLPDRRSTQLPVSEHATVASHSARPPAVRQAQSSSVLGTALKMFLGVLLLAGAFYAGIYVARNYLPPEPPGRNSVPVENDLGALNYLREGAQTDADFREALQLFDNREYTAAHDRFRALTERAPTNARYYYWQARASFEAGNTDAALKGFQKAASLNLNAPTVYLYEALCYHAMKKEREAAESFKRFAEERMNPVRSR